LSDVIVKVCGITRAEDARAAEDAGADLIGLVFAPGPRRLTVEAAERIARSVGCPKVGVFVNEAPATVNAIVRRCGLDYAQLHGDESQADCDAVDVPVIKAIRVQGAADLARAAEYRVFRLLLDAYSASAFGGTGTVLDWDLPAAFPLPYLLAGGLTPANVADAVARLRPWGVDASSGLESAPGIKDALKIAAFVAAANGAA
jgi:phosphoribosylanthranilate isomerase